MCNLCLSYIHDILEFPVPVDHDCYHSFKKIIITQEIVNEFYRIHLKHCGMTPNYRVSAHLIILLVEAGVVRGSLHPMTLARVWFNLKFYAIKCIHGIHKEHSGGFDPIAAGALVRV